MQRRTFLQGLAAASALGSLPLGLGHAMTQTSSVSVETLPKLEGELTLYLGRGEGGLYENVLKAIEKRNPELNLKIRRGGSAALANTIVAETKAGVKRADLFWAVDTGSIGMVTDAGAAKPLPVDLTAQLKEGFQYPSWSPVTGRVRTLPYNTQRVKPENIPDSVMALADSDLKIGWAPAYSSFQSFVTAMRILEGENATKAWLKGINRNAKKYAGELGVVMGVERGEVDIGFANHYYTLRLKSGKPDANVAIAYTNNDAGCLVNASGIVALSDGDLPVNFIRYLLSHEVQSYLAREAYEIPLVQNVAQPEGLASLSSLSPPDMDLRKLADLRPTLNIMRGSRRTVTNWPKSYPLALLVALMALLPVGVLFSLAQDSAQLFDTHNLRVLGNTLSLVLLTIVGSVLIGVPLALFTAYVHMPFKRFWLIVLAAPLALPSYIGAFAMYFSFGRGGEIENVLGISTPPINGLWGAALVMSLYTYPFVMMTTRASLLSLDASLVNAARTLGLTLAASLWRVVLPRVFNSIAAGALLAALYALSDFGTPAIMGLDTFTRVIFVEYNAFGLSQAAMLSLQLMVIVGLILFIESRIGSAKERPGRHLMLFLSRWQRYLVLIATMPVVFMAIVLPLAVFLLWLVREGTGGFEFEYAWNSAHASFIAAIVAVLLAIPVANAAIAGKAGRFMERVTYFGFGVPGIVMGTALVYVGLQLPALYQTLSLLVMAYVLRFIPLAVGSVRTTSENIDSGLVKAARVLGASPREAFMRITLPLTLRGMIAGAALVFLEAMRELPATLMLGPTGFETLATYMWRVYEAGYFGRAAVPGLLLVLLSGVGLILMLSGERKAQFTVTEDERS